VTLRQFARRRRSQRISQRVHAVNEYLCGWTGSYALAETASVMAELDKWPADGSGAADGGNGDGSGPDIESYAGWGSPKAMFAGS
jgi:hypothetical protein